MTRNGIIQFYLKDRGFGYVRVPETGEEFHFMQKNLLESVEDKDAVEFILKEKKNGYKVDQIKKCL